MSSYTEGQSHQLMNRLEAERFTAEELAKLGQHPQLCLLREWVNDRAEIVMKEYIIDCDAKPFLSADWKIKEHIKGGQLRWNPDEIETYLCNEQKSGTINGQEFRKKLAGQPVLNACVLDYLLANPQLIPDEWKGKKMFFWGTIYRNNYGKFCVRGLCWSDGRWTWLYRHLNDDWHSGLFAAVSCK